MGEVEYFQGLKRYVGCSLTIYEVCSMLFGSSKRAVSGFQTINLFRLCVRYRPTQLPNLKLQFCTVSF